MNHEQIKNKNIIEDYLCHQLDTDLVDAFEEHLLFCARCRKELQKKEVLIASIQKAAYKAQQLCPDKRKLKIPYDEKPTDSDNQIHDSEKPYQKARDRYRLLRIAAVITLLIFSASMLGLLLNQITTQGNSNSGIIRNTVVLFKNLYSLHRSHFLRPVNRFVTDESIAAHHLNEMPCFKGVESLDELINNQVRNSKPLIKVRTPIACENIIPDEDGWVKLTFSGLCKYQEIIQNNRIFIHIFANDVQDYFDENTISAFELNFAAKGKNVYTFEVVQQVKLPKGLYYFTIEMRNADPLYVGKFYIDALN